MPGRFPIHTDENVQGPVIEGLRARGWDVVLTIDAFGQRSVDEPVFGTCRLSCARDVYYLCTRQYQPTH